MVNTTAYADVMTMQKMLLLVYLPMPIFLAILVSEVGTDIHPATTIIETIILLRHCQIDASPLPACSTLTVKHKQSTYLEPASA